MVEAPHTRPPDDAEHGAIGGSWTVALTLVALVAAVYWGVGGYGFVNFDDPLYVYQNSHVRAGLTWDGFIWALTSFQVSNWHPLTWLSHMADVELFGLDPGWHHRVNLLLHCIDTVLLFHLLELGTRQRWRSALVAALFGVHPLHVESVAWLAERKDVLSTLFWLLAMIAYVRYVRRPSVARYLLVAAALALGLLGKPMLVTLPLVLLLFDFWPLRRISAEGVSLSKIVPLVKEKMPLFALSAASSAVTYLAQARSGSMSSVEALPLPVRAGNALVSYVVYLAKTIWPTDLAASYPHPGLTPGGIPAWRIAGSALVLAAVSAVVLWQRKRRPYLAMGWFWYLVTLLPVIGLVQVGVQAMADRYTYVPLTGIFIGLAWAIPSVAEASRLRRCAVVSAASLVVLLSAGLARRQVGYWRDSFTLFEHALAVTRDNWTAWRNLGTAYSDARQYAAAIPALRESLRLMPYDAHAAHAWMDLAIAYTGAGQDVNAAECFQKALGMRPNDQYILYNLGIADAVQGQWDRAAEVQERLRQINPEMAQELARRLARARALGEPQR